MKHIFIIFLLSAFHSTSLEAQLYSTKYFEDTRWASLAKDSFLFKKDTVKMVKIIKDTYLINGKGMNVARYFGGDDYFKLEFYKNKRLRFAKTMVEEWVTSRMEGEYTWNYESKTNILNLYFKKRLLGSFSPIPNSKRIVEVASLYAGIVSFKTTEISLKRRQ